MGSIQTEEKTNPSTKKRLLRFRIRTLLVLTTLSAVFLGWMLPIAEQQRQELRARLKLAEKGAKLTSEFTRPAVVRFCLSFLVEKPALKNCVELRSQTLTDADLELVGQLPLIERLYLKHCPISYEGLKHLHSLKHLKRLALWGTPLVDDDLRGLHKIRSLEVLDIHNPVAGGFGSKAKNDSVSLGWTYGAHSKLPDIKREIKNQKRTSACLEHLRGMPNLRWLRFSFWVDDAGLDCLATMPRLNLYSLRIEGPTELGLRHLPRWSGLDGIVIHGASLRGDALAPLKHLPALKSLVVGAATVDETSLGNIADCESLNIVSLRNSSANDAAIRKLATMKKLTHLDLLGTEVTADVIPAIAKSSTLAYLHIDVPLDDEAIIAISGAKSLQEVSTAMFRRQYECYLTQLGFEHLAKDMRIPWLRFHDPAAGAEIKGIDVNTLRPEEGKFQEQWLADLIEKNPAYKRRCQVASGNVSLKIRDAFTLYTELTVDLPLSSYIDQDMPEMTSLNALTNRAFTIQGKKEEENRGLYIKTSSREQPSLRFLRHLPNLEVLELSPERFEGEAEDMWVNLGKLSKLKELRFKTPAGGNAMRNIGSLTSLVKLECPLQNGVTDEDFEHIGNLSSLKWMDLRITHLSDRKASALGKLTSLENLILLGNRSMPKFDDLSFLQSLTSLKELYIGDIDDSRIDQIIMLDWIERLTISGAKISLPQAMKLQNLPRLKYVDIRSATQYKMTDAEMQTFQDAMTAKGVYAR